TLILCSTSLSLGQSPEDGRLQAVLLKTDRVLTGRVNREGEVYRITMDEGSSVAIPIANVVHVGADKLEIYGYKKSQIKQLHGGDHFQLTHWCISNGLLAEAADHYKAVAKEHPNHPRVKQLAQELKSKMLAVPGFREFLGLPPEKSAPVQQLNRIASDQTDASVAMASGFKAAMMHPEIGARFSLRIQPILMNRCSQSACHGSQGKSDLTLLAPYRSNYEKMTTSNLQSVLSQLSTDKKEISPLLKYATTAHGIQRQPGISITETGLLQELTNWIQFVQNPVTSAVAFGKDPGQVTTLGSTASQNGSYMPSMRLVPVQPGGSGLKPVPQADLHGVQFPEGDVPLVGEIDALDEQLRKILGEPATPRGNVPPKGAAPRVPNNDAFDPAEFNRQSQPSAAGN
ncbi:MAG: hypothetical protein AAF483_28615, partial [Planctomycetota bacterium]